MNQVKILINFQNFDPLIIHQANQYHFKITTNLFSYARPKLTKTEKVISTDESSFLLKLCGINSNHTCILWPPTPLHWQHLSVLGSSIIQRADVCPLPYHCLDCCLVTYYQIPADKIHQSDKQAGINSKPGPQSQLQMGCLTKWPVFLEKQLQLSINL